MDAMTTRAPRTPRPARARASIADAKAFLSTLTGNAGVLNISTAKSTPPEKEGKKPRYLGWDHRTLPLPLTPEVWDWLQDENAKGRCIFMRFNEAEHPTGKIGAASAKDVTTIRACPVDFDEGDPSDFLAAIEKDPRPHLLVRSSPDRYHAYWLPTAGMDKVTYKAIQTGLHARYGGDESIKDAGRLLRLPGFINHKWGRPPAKVELLENHPDWPHYTPAELMAAGSHEPKQQKRPPRQPREPRQPSLPAQAAPPADAEKEALMAYINEAAKKVRPRAEVEAEQRAYDLACAADAVGFFQKRGDAEAYTPSAEVGMYLKAATRPDDEGNPPALTDDEGFQLFDAFCQSCPEKYAEEPEWAADKWDHDFNEGPSGLGVLLNAAKQAGWTQPPHPKSAIAQQIAEVGDWVQLLARPKRGNPYSHLLNVTTALENAPQLKGVFRYDQMAQCTVQTRRIGATKPYPNGPVEVTDRELSSLMRLLNNAGMVAVSADTAARAVELVASENAFHPLQEYLTGLEWDGTKRLDTWLPEYLGTEDSPYTRRVGRMWLIALCARAMQPGVKMDTMPVLTGKQGVGKSTALCILGGEWFTDQIPDLRNHERLSMSLRGVWVAELAELSATRKSDAELLKHTITAREQRYRPPYARKDVIEPRTCVFVGTTNADTFLNDPTGGRRFWPVTVGEIDLDGLTSDRNQLFAEAMQAYQAGEKWWPERDEEAALFVPMQEAAQQEDPWLEPIRGYLERMGGAEDFTCTASSILSEAVGIGRDKISPADCRRASAILQAEGMEVRRSKGNRVFHKPKK